MAISRGTCSSSAPTASAAAAATMAAEATEGRVLSRVSNRLRALRKKASRIKEMEEAVATGKTLNREQEELLGSKHEIAARIEVLESLKPQLASALAEELSDSSVKDIVALLYFGSVFDTKEESELVALASRRELERNRCLSYDCVGDDPEDSLAETDLNAVAALASLATSRPAAPTGVSHKDALQACVHHARLWLRRADEPIHTDSNLTYARVRERLDRIMASGYSTAEQVASFEAGGVLVEESMVQSAQAPEAVEDNPFVEASKATAYTPMDSFGVGSMKVQVSITESPQAPAAVEDQEETTCEPVNLATAVASFEAQCVQVQESMAKSEAPGGLKDSVKRLFFLTDNDSEIYESLENYVHPDPKTPPVVETSVAGDDRTCLKSSPRARRGTTALTIWHIDLHGEGYVLHTDICLNDFAVDYFGNLRGKKHLLGKITKGTSTMEEKVRTNMLNVAVLAESGIYLGLLMPHDLQHLLGLLKNYAINLSPLVRGHAAHNEGLGQNVLYDILCGKLRVLAKLDRALHSKILKALGEMPEVSSWLEKALLNIHLHRVLRYQQGTTTNLQVSLESLLTEFMNTTVQYLGNAAGLIDFRRNSHKHLEEDYSVDQVGNLEAGMYGIVEAFKMFHKKELEKLDETYEKLQKGLKKKHDKEQENLYRTQEDGRQRMPSKHQKRLEDEEKLNELQGWWRRLQNTQLMARKKEQMYRYLYR